MCWVTELLKHHRSAFLWEQHDVGENLSLHMVTYGFMFFPACAFSCHLFGHSLLFCVVFLFWSI